MKYSLALAALAAGTARACPGSDSWTVHAKCEMTVKFSNSCSEVAAEMFARVDSDSWVDPHNGGTYTLETSGYSTMITGTRKTGDGKYMDKFDFDLQSSRDDKSCSVTACSESQVTSVLDGSTNYCNLHSLYCNSADGCPTIGSELSYTETYSSCSQHDNVCVASKEETEVVQLETMNALLSSGADADADAEPCCNDCPVEGEEKYYSIDKIFNMCGECCMKVSNAIPDFLYLV